MDKALKKLYKIKKLEEGLFAVSSSAVMSYVLVGNKKALVLDTAYGFGDLHAVVRKITGLPLVVVNSHGHIDHTGGNFCFPEPVYLHEADRGFIRSIMRLPFTGKWKRRFGYSRESSSGEQ